MTREEVETECDFVMGVIEKEHRQPTFDDAIKYGMRLQKKQMMAKAIDAEVLENYDGRSLNMTKMLLMKNCLIVMYLIRLK